MDRPPYTAELVVRDLGRMPYAEAFTLQKTLQQEVIAHRPSRGSGSSGPGSSRAGSNGPGWNGPGSNGPGSGAGGSMYVLLVEHAPPVITVSRRVGARRHLVATPAQLAAAGVEVAETDRGGDITYHGPGQLVVYPILDLNAFGLRLHSYMRFLEQVVIDVLDGFGVRGVRDATATGVWVAGDRPGAEARKICAMGVRVSRWVSMHGLALNVTTNLAHFDLIVPCGLVGRSVTSLERELGEACPSMATVKGAIARAFARATAERRSAHPDCA